MACYGGLICLQSDLFWKKSLTTRFYDYSGRKDYKKAKEKHLIRLRLALPLGITGLSKDAPASTEHAI